MWNHQAHRNNVSWHTGWRGEARRAWWVLRQGKARNEAKKGKARRRSMQGQARLGKGRRKVRQGKVSAVERQGKERHDAKEL
jgi:hypothetical protein